MTFTKVSFWCPNCWQVCGWDEKRKQYNAVEVESDDPNTKQYAHRACFGDGREPLANSARAKPEEKEPLVGRSET